MVALRRILASIHTTRHPRRILPIQTAGPPIRRGLAMEAFAASIQSDAAWVEKIVRDQIRLSGSSPTHNGRDLTYTRIVLPIH